MQRCLNLAQLGAGKVAPNPMVGAILVYGDRIIGEGYHQEYGKAHAEVNCIGSVRPDDRPLIPKSTLYVSLEPCAHFGKTPPCADLVIKQKIPRVVVGCRDPFEQVNGKGIEKLEAAGVEVIPGMLEEDCRMLNRRFFGFHTLRRPYVVLKWAQTADGRIAAAPLTNGQPERLLISNACSNRLVHRWRSEEVGILVGTNTALLDDPGLTTRLWPGSNPVRLVIDMDLKLPGHLQLFNSDAPTVVFNLHKHSLPFDNISPGLLRENGISYYQVSSNTSLVPQLMNALYRLNILSVLVEGGGRLLQSIIDEGLWDEARIITNETLTIGKGLPAPALKNQKLRQAFMLGADQVKIYANQNMQTS